MYLTTAAAACAFAVLMSSSNTTGPNVTHKPSTVGTYSAANFDPSSELLLMDIVYDQLKVDQALSVLQDKQGRRFMPVRQFSSGLGFRLHVDADKLLAKGFLISPKDSFELDGLAGVCRHGKTVVHFSPTLAFSRDGEMYLDAELYSKLTGLHLLWQMNLLQIEVSSDSPLNVERQWIQRARDQMQQSTAERLSHYETISLPYKMWSPPSVDAQLYTAEQTGLSATDSASRLSLIGAGDLFMMSAQYRIVSDTQGNPSALLSLGRFDPNGKMLGPLHAKQLEFGDLYLPPEPLLARGRNGLGLQISNFPLPGQDRTLGGKISGPGTPGSLIELYNADVLVDSTTCRADGQYTFDSPRLDLGPNNLKIVHVEAGGVVTEEDRRVYGDPSGPERGENRYRFTACRVGSTLYNSDSFTNVQNQDTDELIGEFQAGLSSGTWTSALGALTNSASGSSEELGLGIHTWSGGLLWHAQSMLGLSGGQAFSTGVATRIGRSTLSLDRTQATGSMASRILPEIGTNANALTELRLEGLGGKKGHEFSYALSGDQLDGTVPTTMLRARLTAGNANLLVSNSLAWQLSQGQSTISGFAQVRKEMGGSLGLLDLGYNLAGGYPIQLARLSANRSIAPTYSVRYGLEYDATRPEPLGVLGTIFKSLGPVDLGLNIECLERGTVKANLMFSVGLRGDAGRGATPFARPGVGESGSVTARIFIDKHLTGKYESDDPLLPEVGFLVNGHPRYNRSNKRGVCVLDRLSPNQQVSVALDEDSFEDPNWVSEKSGVTIMPRPGRQLSLDFPIVVTSELDGRLTDKPFLATHPGLMAQLVSKSTVVDTSILDSLGGYVFSRVRPGDYELRVVDMDGKTIGSRKIKVEPGANMKGLDVEGPRSEVRGPGF